MAKLTFKTGVNETRWPVQPLFRNRQAKPFVYLKPHLRQPQLDLTDLETVPGATDIG